jgi:hypothetical protein
LVYILFNTFYTKLSYKYYSLLIIKTYFIRKIYLLKVRKINENIQFPKKKRGEEWEIRLITIYFSSVFKSSQTDMMAINIIFSRRYHRLLVISLYDVIAHNGAKSITLK